MPIDASGITVPTVTETLAGIEADQAVALGDSVESGAASPLGQLNAIVADQLRDLGDLVLAVYAAMDEAGAAGDALDRLCALTGTTRLPAQPSVVDVEVTLAASSSIPAGSLVLSVDGAPSRRFVSVEDAINVLLIEDTVTVQFESEDTGPVEAPAGTLTVLAESAPGFVSASNTLDAALGSDIENDETLRRRRRDELSRPGTSTVDAIRVDVLDAVVDAEGDRKLRDVIVFENTGDVTDGDGVPPKAIEVVAWDGTALGTLAAAGELLQAVWNAKPAGILAHGDETGTATDSRGDARPSAFSRPTVVDVDVEVTIDPASGYVSGTHDPVIAAALAAYAQLEFSIAEDVVLTRLFGVVYDAVDESVVLDVTQIRLRRDADPLAEANVAIGSREIAAIATGDVTILTV